MNAQIKGIVVESVWARIRLEGESLKRWQEEQRAQTWTCSHEPIENLANALRPLIFFLAKGAGHHPKATVTKSRIGTLHMRAWLLLYVMRPDLLGGESMAEAANRFSVSKVCLAQIMRDFRKCVPGFVCDTNSRRGYNSEREGQRAKKSLAQTRVWAERRRACRRMEAFNTRGREVVA